MTFLIAVSRIAFILAYAFAMVAVASGLIMYALIFLRKKSAPLIGFICLCGFILWIKFEFMQYFITEITH